MKNRLLRSLLPIGMLAISSIAHGEEPIWLVCKDQAPERQLACYQGATQSYLEQNQPSQPMAPEKPASTGKYDWKLDHLWPKPQELATESTLANTFLQYKQNYLLLDSIHSPSNSPHSPNPANVVPPSKLPQTTEMKFQISLKAQLPVTWPWQDTAWFGYTQQSRWQAFHNSDSRPFRESDYEPELIFLSHRFDDSVPTLGALTPRFLNLSYLHQSNGQSLPRSRSWNRLTAQLGSEYRFAPTEEGEEKKLAVLLRPWWRMPEHANTDDNPDITDYLGHGDIEIDYWHGRGMYSLLLRSRAVQLDWSFPLTDEKNDLKLHLQYFSGYGESLIDYNQKLHSFGIGVSLPFYTE